jgi:hypothetical protein
MRQTLLINLGSVLNRPDRRDVGDGFNDDPVLVLSESRRGDMEAHHTVCSRISHSLHRAPEKASFISLDAASPLVIFLRVVQNHLTRLQDLCAAWSHGNYPISPGPI